MSQIDQIRAKNKDWSLRRLTISAEEVTLEKIRAVL